MKYTFSNLVNIQDLQELLDTFHAAMKLPCTVNSPNGEILVSAGWPKYCSHFHHNHPEIEKNCLREARQQTSKLKTGNEMKIFQCPRGLITCSTPILINHQHLATLFSGQILIVDKSGKPDPNYQNLTDYQPDEIYKLQDEQGEIIKLTWEQYEKAFHFLVKLAKMISELGYKRLRELEVHEKKIQNRQQFADVFSQGPLGFSLVDLKTSQIIEANDTILRDMEYTREEVIGSTSKALDVYADYAERDKIVAQALKNGFVSGVECNMRTKSGRIINYLLSMALVKSGNRHLMHTVFFNNSSRMEQYRTLLKSEEKWKLLVQILPEFISILDLEMRYQFLNKYADGFSPENTLGKVALEYISKDDQQDFKKHFEECVQTKKPVYFNNLAYGDHYEEKHYENILVPIIESNEVQGVLCVGRDITEKQLIHKALESSMDREKKNNELLRSILESPEGMIMFSLDSELKYIAFTISHKETMKALYGVDIELGMYIIDGITNDSDRESALSNFKKVFSGENLVLKEQYGSQDYQRVWYETRYSPMYDDHKNINGITVFVIDITKRILAEQAIFESESRLKGLINNVDAMIWAIDKDYKLICSNNLFQKKNLEFFGREILPGEIVTTLPGMDEKFRNEWEGYFNRCLNGEEVNFERIAVLSKAPIYEWISLRPFRDVYDEIIGIAIVVHDITAQKISVSQLAQQTEELKTLNASKDKFFSIIAHDLKNPFNSILGFSDLLAKDIDKYSLPEIQRYIGHINNSSKQAFELLENLLIWARTQRDAIEFLPEVLDLSTMVTNTINLLENQAESKNISISTKINEQLIVFADKNMIETVLRNLITNAIKFTYRDGSICISGEKQGNEIRISVRDNGVGIRPENLDSIFKIDSKTNTLGTEKEKGSGLMLILSKEFIEKHAGKIWVESKPGSGSVFHFSLPIA